MLFYFRHSPKIPFGPFFYFQFVWMVSITVGPFYLTVRIWILLLLIRMFCVKQIFAKYGFLNASGIRLQRFRMNASVDLPEYDVVSI